MEKIKDIIEDILFVFTDLKIEDIAVIILMGICEVVFVLSIIGLIL